VLRFEVTAETYALFREALLELRRRSASAFDDDTALLELARCVLGGAALGKLAAARCDESSGPNPLCPSPKAARPRARRAQRRGQASGSFDWAGP
jgi:hypothetical protein